MIYLFNYKILTQQLTPNFYAFLQNISWQNSLIKPIEWLRDRLFISVSSGDNATNWSNMVNYVLGDKVQYGESIFECLKNNINILPSNSEYWVLLTSDRIGINERILFKNNKLAFELALNKRFKTTFKNPNSYTTPDNSDIYITNIDSNNSFVVEGDSVLSTISTGFVYSVYVPSQVSFNINVPIATFNLYGENLIRFYADKINNAGLKYSIITY